MADQPNPLIDFARRYSRRTAGQEGPVLFVREVFGANPDPWQVEALQAYGRGERRISIRSGHGVGKTTLLAWIIIHHMLTEYPQKTVCTAPTTKQLFDALAAETKAWIYKLPAPLQALFEIKSESIELKGAPDASFVSFRTSSAERPEAMAGVHSENVLLILDEASGIPEPIFESAFGSLAGENRAMLLTGNPTRTAGTFFDTHHRLADIWWTRKVSSADCPRIPKDYIEDARRRYGESSNAFRVRVLGEFPLGEADTVIPRALVEAALARDVKLFNVRPVWGLDCARGGDDKTALAKRQGNGLQGPTQEKDFGRDTMPIVGWVKNQWDASLPSERPEMICVDAIGVGAGVADRLRELGLPVYAVMVSESPAMTDHYPRLRDELWFKGQEWLQKLNSTLCGDRELAEELCRPTYTYMSSGKRAVETKEKLKKRGFPSPNRADAFLLTLCHEAATASQTGGNSPSWNQPLVRPIKGIV